MLWESPGSRHRSVSWSVQQHLEQWVFGHGSWTLLSDLYYSKEVLSLLVTVSCCGNDWYLESCCPAAALLYNRSKILHLMVPQFLCYSKDKCCFPHREQEKSTRAGCCWMISRKFWTPHVSVSTLQWWMLVRVFEGMKQNNDGGKPSFVRMLLSALAACRGDTCLLYCVVR